MKLAAHVWSAMLVIGSLPYVAAVAPRNDNCSGAIAITPGTSTWGNLTLATTDFDAVRDRNSCRGTLSEVGLWYTFTGTGGTLWPFTCFPNYIDVSISIYGGSCGVESLQCLTGESTPCSNAAQFDISTIEGNTYYMLVRSTTKMGFELLLSNIRTAPPKLNDVCADAIPMTIGSSMFGNLTLATADVADVPFDCVAGSLIGTRAGIWYSFDGLGTNVTIDTCSKSSDKTHISVYTGGCGNLKCVTGTLNACTLPKFTFFWLKREPST